MEAGHAVRHVAPIRALPIPAFAKTAAIADFYPPLLESRASTLGYSPSFNASSILARKQAYQIQVLASTFSSCSILAALCAIYWFWMMRRNFRRDLILLLICGDFWKAAWLLVFSSMSLADGLVSTKSSFCQASGFFLQVGFEACDIAIFFMSLHMQLQIFPPKISYLGHDGLYRLRRLVTALWVVVPMVIASLAFTNRPDAFVSQGGFCTLPIRPFWYRLALSWIPRYLVWIYVMFVAIKIYRHVGFEFKVFGEERDGSSTFGVEESASTPTNSTYDPVAPRRNLPLQSDGAMAEKEAGTGQVFAPNDDELDPSTPTQRAAPTSAQSKVYESSRKHFVPNWSMPFGTPDVAHTKNLAGPIKSLGPSEPSSRQGSRHVAAGSGVEDLAPPPTLGLDQHRVSVSTTGSMKSTGAHSFDPASTGLGTIAEQQNPESTANVPGNAANNPMQQRRRAIQRQLRLLFIYPCVYLLMWVFPFVAHAMLYSDHYAQHPIFAISALSIFFQASMGSVDVIVFCWREKPWRHIPGSDGTFVGSFIFWRFAFDSQWSHQRRKSTAPPGILQTEEKTESSQTGLLGSLKRWSMSITGREPSPRSSQGFVSSTPRVTAYPPARKTAPSRHRRTHSGGSDRRVLEAERAHARLAMERAEYQQSRKSLDDRRTSVISASPLAAQVQQASPSRREWWDRHMSVFDDSTT